MNAEFYILLTVILYPIDIVCKLIADEISNTNYFFRKYTTKEEFAHKVLYILFPFGVLWILFLLVKSIYKWFVSYSKLPPI